ncbi:MAG: DNA primase [Deltaproteobacteria bacterium]|nr:DNA primase [Deltaproteobacteria bacterium]
MAYIPEDKLLEIKDAASLEEVVGQYVKLSRRGRNLVGLCPFHADSKPSFTVALDKGIFYCFGCGAGGNVFSFVMQYHRLSFPEAVEELARRYGIPLSLRDLGPQGAKAGRKRQLFYDLHAQAAAFYRQNLEGPAGGPARDYLRRRNLTPEIIREYQLGYALPEWDSLRRHLQNKGLSLELAQEAGLLVARPGGGYYDRFRDRVMFPIADRTGRIVAFGGRVMGDGEPKYLNSPESPLYSKGRLLYGLPQAAAALRQADLALVVEGYLDLLALKVHGIHPVLATLGTALTREQARLLKSLASRVVLVFDGDAAGAAAVRRAFPLCAEEGLAVRTLPLPAGLDPDSYVQAHGPELFISAWDNAQPMFAFLLEGLIQTHGMDIDGRVRLLAELRPFFQALKDPVEQDLWLRFTAGRLGVEEGSLRLSLAAPVSPTASPPENRRLALSLEKRLVKWVLQNPQGLNLEELEEWAQEFDNRELKEILSLIIDCCRKHGNLDVGLLIQRAEEEEQQRQICALSLGEAEFGAPAADTAAGDWRRALLRRRLRKAEAALKEKLTTALADPENAELPALLAQSQEIQRKIQSLKSEDAGKGEDG